VQKRKRLCWHVRIHKARRSIMSELTTPAIAISLTIWSSRRPQAPLASALRASHSGAAYRER
jgi:hypothetical protein